MINRHPEDAKNEIEDNQDSAQASDNAVVKDLRDQLVDVFIRDWQSPHCKFVE